QSGTVTLTNQDLVLTIAIQPWYNPRQLHDASTGRTFADSDYVWSYGASVRLIGPPQLTAAADGAATAIFRLQQGHLEIEHTFRLPRSEPNVLLETIQLHNPGAQAADTASFACGFGKRLRTGPAWLADVAQAN